MSLQQVVFNQLRSQGNSNPPGRPAGPGQALPVYQDNGGARWDGPATGVGNAPHPRVIKAHIGLNNSYIVNAQTLVNWKEGEETRLREGQLLFAAREDAGDRRLKAVSLQHLNSICRRGYKAARKALETKQGLPAGVNITAADFDALRHEELFEYLGKEEKIPKHDTHLLQACRLLSYKYFKYLTWHGVANHWNFWGVINNLNVATSMEGRIDPSQSKLIVANAVVGKKAHTSNIWGGRDKVREGSRLSLIMRCTHEDGVAAHTEIVPWAGYAYEVAPYCDRTYFDRRGHLQLGHEIFVGTVTETTNSDPVEHKRRLAVGNTEAPLSVVHDAYGTLPKIVIQVRIVM